MISRGVINVLSGKPWKDEFDLSPNAFWMSFIAILLYVPLCFIVAAGAAKYNDAQGYVPYNSIALILLVVSLTFPLIALILCSLFDKKEHFRTWVIVRNWAMLGAWGSDGRRIWTLSVGYFAL